MYQYSVISEPCFEKPNELFQNMWHLKNSEQYFVALHSASGVLIDLF
jgi:hypothetical protein